MSSGPSVTLDNSSDPYPEESTVCVCVHVWECVRACVCVCGGSVCLNTNVGFNALYTDAMYAVLGVMAVTCEEGSMEP